jgi:hypothetical protein
VADGQAVVAAGEADRRSEMVQRYTTVQPFLPMLTEVVPSGATGAGALVLGLRRVTAACWWPGE